MLLEEASRVSEVPTKVVPPPAQLVYFLSLVCPFSQSKPLLVTCLLHLVIPDLHKLYLTV